MNIQKMVTQIPEAIEDFFYRNSNMKALKKRAKADLRNREFSIFLTNFATFQIRFRRQKSFSSVFTMRHNDKNCI